MAIIPIILSQEIKDKYQIVNNSFRYIAKPNLKDLLVCEIGDVKTPDTFIPQMKIGRWGNSEEDNECNVSIRLIHNEKGTEKVKTIGDKIKWSRGNLEAYFYDIPEGEGASEFEIILKSKPKTNVISFSLADKDVDYFYQPALTQKEIAEGASRPENVEGSYAIYAKTPKTNWVGGKLYRTGKIGHIYRPKIIDSAGTEVWGILNIDKGILSVEIPQEFLDNAVYPVRHAAGLTFGYTSVGGTTAYPGSSRVLVASTYTHSAVTGDIVTKYSIYGQDVGSLGHTVDMTCYTVVSAEAVTRLAVGTTITIPKASSLAWYDSAAISQSLTNGTTYGVAVGAFVGTAGNLSMRYDTGATNSVDRAGDYNLPATWVHSAWSIAVWSIYATYTAAGGTPTDKFFLMFS